MRKCTFAWITIVILFVLLSNFLFAGRQVKEEKAVKKEANKAALLLITRRGDLAAVDNCVGGMLKAEKEFDLEAKIIECRDATEYADNIRAMVDWGADIIFCQFQPLVTPAVESARENPNIKYVLIYGNYDNPPENVLSVFYRDVEATYIAGVMAAMKTKTGKVALTTGADIPSQRYAYNGFVQGVHSINPKIETYFAVIGSFEDIARGKEVALSLFSQGIDVICGWAAKSDHGTCEAAQETGNYVVGLAAMVDLREKYPGVIIGQVGVDFGATVYELIKSYLNGKWEGGIKTIRTIHTHDVDFLYEPSTSDGWTEDQIVFIKKIRQDILDRKIVIKD